MQALQAMEMVILIMFFSMWSTVKATGYMNTIATMRGRASEEQNSFALCVLRARTTQPLCWGTFILDDDISPPSNISLWSINGGAYFSCGLLSGSHFPVCWGQSPGSVVPSEFQNVSYSEVNCGGWHACGVRSNMSGSPGVVDCWGRNDFDQTRQPSHLSQMVSVTAGEYFTCALVATTGRPRCWGRISNNDVVIPEDMVFFKIFAGRIHVCGILGSSREALCWGDNDHGQCDVPKGVTFSALAPGIYHTCGIRDDTHEVLCWGDNKYMQLQVPPGFKFAVISSGDWYTCGATLGDGKFICWGSSRSPESLRVKQGLCSDACEAEQYEALNLDAGGCTGANERICLPCARCKNGTYQSSPCVPFSDNICSDCKWCFSREKPDHSCRNICQSEPAFDIPAPMPASAPRPQTSQDPPPPDTIHAPSPSASAGLRSTWLALLSLAGFI